MQLDPQALEGTCVGYAIYARDIAVGSPLNTQMYLKQ